MKSKENASVTSNFQVNLEGIIALLSNHLYSAPKVYIRELLQNATDAITARKKIDPGFEGQVHVHVFAGETPSLSFEDNGIGLTPEEVQLFLSNIGASTKRDGSTDYIGQFGIGLLACFMVTDEIVLITRSAKGGPAIEWKGKADGTFVTRLLSTDCEPGTKVFLRAKSDAEYLFEPDKVEALLRYYGDLLPYPVLFSAEHKEEQQVNRGLAPFEKTAADAVKANEILLDFGKDTFNEEFLAAIPLRSTGGKTTGVAYILKTTPSLANKPKNKVYLKRMLLSDENQDILPDWAFFVKAIINTNELKPTASREAFYQDETLAKVRKHMGRCIRNYIVQLHQEKPALLEKIIETHRISMKMLAKDDDELFRIIIHHLRFPTTLGNFTIREYLQHSTVLYHIPNLEDFEKIKNIAKSHGMVIINSRFDFDEELLDKLPTIYEGIQVVKTDVHALLERLETLYDLEQKDMEPLLEIAEEELSQFRCKAIARKFEPVEIPALHYMDSLLNFERYTDRVKAELPSLWGNILGGLSEGKGFATICFNYNNPLVQQLAGMKNTTVVRHYVRLLYIQALLLGNFQLTSEELGLLTEGLSGLLQSHIEKEPTNGKNKRPT